MSNYEQLILRHKEFETIRKDLEPTNGALLDDIEIKYDFNVVDINTGQLGYAKPYHDSTDVCFIIPSQDFTEKRISREEFNQHFLELPKDLIEKIAPNERPFLLISKDKRYVGVLDRNNQHEVGGHTYTAVEFLNGEIYINEKTEVEWLNDNVAREL